MPSACAELARLADQIADDVGGDPRAFLVRFGQEAAGIGTGLSAVWDLLRSGRTELRGGGFRPELADHSGSQTRHFAGTARAVTVMGPRATLWLGEHVRRDPVDSPDGRLSILAVEFATGLLDGTASPRGSGDWIRRRLCAR